MILSDKKLREYIERGELVFPCNVAQINPASVNLTLGNTFLTPMSISRPVKLGEKVEYMRYEKEEFILRPGEFALATHYRRDFDEHYQRSAADAWNRRAEEVARDG